MDTAEKCRLLIIAAEAREFSGVLRHARAVKRLRWPVEFGRSAKLNGVPVVLVANGPGPVLAKAAVEAAVDRTRPEAIVSTGFCGALDPALASGEVFVALRVESGGMTYAATAPWHYPGKLRTGTLVSVDRVVNTVGEKARLRERGAAVVDMEAGAVALEACRNRVPFYCIRAVLDCANEGFALDFNLLRGADGRFSRSLIVKAALKRPAAYVPELLKLARRGERASRALGDFLANCEF